MTQTYLVQYATHDGRPECYALVGDNTLSEMTTLPLVFSEYKIINSNGKAIRVNSYDANTDREKANVKSVTYIPLEEGCKRVNQLMNGVHVDIWLDPKSTVYTTCIGYGDAISHDSFPNTYGIPLSEFEYKSWVCMYILRHPKKLTKKEGKLYYDNILLSLQDVSKLSREIDGMQIGKSCGHFMLDGNMVQ